MCVCVSEYFRHRVWNEFNLTKKHMYDTKKACCVTAVVQWHANIVTQRNAHTPYTFECIAKCTKMFEQDILLRAQLNKFFGQVKFFVTEYHVLNRQKLIEKLFNWCARYKRELGRSPSIRHNDKIDSHLRFVYNNKINIFSALTFIG